MTLNPATVETHIVGDKAEWLARRQQDLTASDVGALFNAPPIFKSLLQLYLQKTQGSATDIDNEAMRRGRWLEPVGIEALKEIKPDWEMTRSDAYLRSPEYRFGATPDLLNHLGEPVEVKNPMGMSLRKWDGNPPLGYQLQALSQAMLLDAPRAWVIGLEITAYTAKAELFEIERNERAEARILQSIDDFWNRVARNDPPGADPELDYSTVFDVYPRAREGVEVDLLADNRLPVLLAERADWKAQVKDLTAKIKAADTELKSKIGEAEFALVNGFDVSWKNQTRKSYTVAESQTRVLRVKDIRPESERF